MQGETKASADRRKYDPKKAKRQRDAAKESISQRIPKRGYSPAETAVALGVSLPTVNRGLYSGKIPSTKILGRRIVSAETCSVLQSLQ